MGEQLHAEQSHFWNRFAAFAALHAGLLIVAIETSGWARELTALLGIGLTVLWLAVQSKSREYVERWKAPFHEYRRKQRLLWRSEWKMRGVQLVDRNRMVQGEIDSRERSSTRLAILVPWALFLPWLILMWLATIDLWPKAPSQPTSTARAAADSTKTSGAPPGSEQHCA